MNDQPLKIQSAAPFDVHIERGLVHCRGVGANVERFRCIIAQNPLLTVDAERQHLQNFVTAQHELLRAVVGLVYPLEALLSKQKFDMPVIDDTPGADEQEGGSAPKKTYPRRPMITPVIADGIVAALATVKAAKEGPKRTAIVEEAAHSIFVLVGYTVIRDAVDHIDPKTAPKAMLSKVREQVSFCEKTRTILHHSNARLVMHEASELSRRSNISIDDLIQEGSLGLLIAIDRYMTGFAGTEGKDTKLSTVAKRWIRAKMTRWMSDHAETIRLPDHLQKKSYKLSRAVRELVAKLGKDESEISDADLADASGLNQKDVRVLRHTLPKVTSMHSPVAGKDGGETSIEETIADQTQTADGMVNSIDQRDMQPAIYEALRGINLTERMMLGWLYEVPSQEQLRPTLLQFGQTKIDALKRRVEVITTELARNPEAEEVKVNILVIGHKVA